MSLIILGNGTFQDACLPLKGKSVWGMDTLTRRMTGARSLAEAFNATLQQGQVYQGYYLQTWEWDDNPDVATVTLNYKGLVTGGTPIPDIQREIVTAKGSVSKSYADLNNGLGLLYRKDLLWQTGDTVPGPGDFGTTAAYVRDRYTTGVTMEFTYKAIQARYRYVKQGQPMGPSYDSVGVNYPPVIEDARIVTADGSIYGRIDWQQFFGLYPIQLTRLISFSANNVIGSPYWECEDVLRLELTDPD